MGRASSSKKVARAARASGKPGSSRNILWPASIGLVVLLGIVLIVVSRPGPADATPPRIGDHWHAAYGIYLCGEFQPALNDARADTTGIHSHGDGLIHIHPFSSAASGKGANLETFGETVDMEISDDRLKLPGREALENGDDCGGNPGIVQVKVWNDIDDTEGHLLDGDFGDFAPQDGEIVTIAFLPEGEDIPRPPSAGTVPTDLPGATPTEPGQDESTTTSAPGESTTTAPPATTATTAAP